MNNNSKDWGITTRTFSSFTDYTQYHFTREDALMEACEYPGLENHRELHRRLTSDLIDLDDTWKKERSQETFVEFRKFLKDWLFDHILNQDVEITPYTKGKDREIIDALQNL